MSETCGVFFSILFHVPVTLYQITRAQIQIKNLTCYNEYTMNISSKHYMGRLWKNSLEKYIIDDDGMDTFSKLKKIIIIITIITLTEKIKEIIT